METNTKETEMLVEERTILFNQYAFNQIFYDCSNATKNFFATKSLIQRVTNNEPIKGGLNGGKC